MDIKSKIIKVIKTVLGHRHNWVLISTYHSKDHSYGHDHYECECGCCKHIKRHWNQAPSIKIFRKNRAILGVNNK